MFITLIFLAAVAAVVVWWLLPQNLGAEPSVVHGAIEDPRPDGYFPSAKVGLWVFLAVVTSVFALFVSAYFIRMELSDWTPLRDPRLLWVNTVLLLVGSAAFQRARVMARNEKIDGVKISLIAAGVFTMAFLIGQFWAWQQLRSTGYLLSTNPANAFFYLITALHGLHMVGGLWVWGKTTLKVFGGARPDQISLSVELCTIYWHYLLLIWLALFGLLLAT